MIKKWLKGWQKKTGPSEIPPGLLIDFQELVCMQRMGLSREDFEELKKSTLQKMGKIWGTTQITLEIKPETGGVLMRAICREGG